MPKLSELTEDTSPTGDGMMYVLKDPSGTPVPRKVTLTNLTKALLAASETAAGVVELATDAEVVTGTDTSRAVTSASLTLAAIVKALIDAKGDLIVGTGNNTVTRLAASGTDGLVLKTASGEASGLIWGEVGNPVGTVIAWAGADTAVSPPTGYLVCDGSTKSRTTYAALFACIGTKYGVGDGSTTFNLPAGTTGQALTGIAITATSRATSKATGNESADHGHSWGGTSGTGSANHSHSISIPSDGSGHTHTHTDYAGSGDGANTKTTSTGSAGHSHSGASSGSDGASHTHYTSGTTTGVSANHNHTLSVMELTYLIKF